MSQPSHLGPAAVLRGYFHAKDENRPYMLSDVFSAKAELRVNNNAANITFPAVTHGREAIGEVLVRRFAQTYENIYSFYMARPPSEATQFSCDWLVGMSEKDSENVRVGCGRYDWTFETESPHLASHLAITIEAMQVLPPSQFAPIFAWLKQLNYPWSSAAAVRKIAPSVEMLAPVLQYLGRNDGGA
jgi:hypothetical protein